MSRWILAHAKTDTVLEVRVWLPVIQQGLRQTYPGAVVTAGIDDFHDHARRGWSNWFDHVALGADPLTGTPHYHGCIVPVVRTSTKAKGAATLVEKFLSRAKPVLAWNHTGWWVVCGLRSCSYAVRESSGATLWSTLICA